MNLRSPWRTLAAVLSLSALTLAAQNQNQNQNQPRAREREQNRPRQNAPADVGRDRTLHRVMPADHLIGRNVQTRQGENLGELSNLIVDFESGRVIYGVVNPDRSLGGQEGRLAVPPSLFRLPPRPSDQPGGQAQTARNQDQEAQDREELDRRKPLTVTVNRQQFVNAPRLTADQEQRAVNVNFANQVYRHFNVSPWWNGGNGQFGHVHRANQVPGMRVRNVSNENLGRTDQVLVDLPAGRLVYASIIPAGESGPEGQIVPLPPMALTQGDEKSFVLDADRNKLQNAPKTRLDAVSRLSDPQFATQVYRYWGKQPYFEAVPTPTGRDGNNDNGGLRSRPSNDRGDFRGGNPAPVAVGYAQTARQGQDPATGQPTPAKPPTPAARPFGRLQSSEQFLGKNVQNAQGDDLGEVQEVVADLESGRLIYVVIDPGAGGQVAVPPTLFQSGRPGPRAGGPARTDTDEARPPRAESQAGREPAAARPLTANLTKQQLEKAPRFTQEQDQKFDDPAFAAKVYQAFNETPWWETGGGAGKFGHAHKVSDLIGTDVRNVSNEEVGEVQDLYLDLPAGRVTLVLLDAGDYVDAEGSLFPVPPMTLTPGKDRDFVTINADKAKLQGAPKVQEDNLRQLQNPTFAAQVYRYWGKQPYWGTTLTPTGPEDRPGGQRAPEPR